MKFRIGDEVRCTEDYQRVPGLQSLKGLCGVIKAIDKPFFAVEFYTEVNGHWCDGHTVNGRGWWLIKEHLEHIETFEGNV